MITLNQLIGIACHTHIPEVVESEFAVGTVGDVAVVLFTAFIGHLHILQTADGESEEAEDHAHPAGVAAGKVIVDGDELTVASGECIEVERHGCHQSFTFTGRHFRD